MWDSLSPPTYTAESLPEQMIECACPTLWDRERKSMMSAKQDMHAMDRCVLC